MKCPPDSQFYGIFSDELMKVNFSDREAERNIDVKHSAILQSLSLPCFYPFPSVGVISQIVVIEPDHFMGTYVCSERNQQDIYTMISVQHKDRFLGDKLYWCEISDRGDYV